MHTAYNIWPIDYYEEKRGSKVRYLFFHQRGRGIDAGREMLLGPKKAVEYSLLKEEGKNGIMGLQAESVVKTAVPLSLSRISLKA